MGDRFTIGEVGDVLRVEKLKAGSLPPLSFELPGGECLAVEGPSGSGKTRLLRAIADLDPAPGYVYLESIERREMPAMHWRRRVRYVAAEAAWWALDLPRFSGEPFAPAVSCS